MRSLSGFLCPYQSFFASFFYYNGIPVSFYVVHVFRPLSRFFMHPAIGLKPPLCKTLFLCKTLRKVIE